MHYPPSIRSGELVTESGHGGGRDVGRVWGRQQALRRRQRGVALAGERQQVQVLVVLTAVADALQADDSTGMCELPPIRLGRPG